MQWQQWLMAVTAVGTLGTLPACGGGDAAGLKYRVADKEVVGLSTEQILRIEQKRGEVAGLEAALKSSESDLKVRSQSVKSTGQQKSEAQKAVKAADKQISATSGAQSKELDQAKETYNKQVAELKAKYEGQVRDIKDKYAKQQGENRSALAAAKSSQALIGLEEALQKAELDEAKARHDLQKQELRTQKARFESLRYEEILNASGVVGPEQQQRKINFEQQQLNEEKKLVSLQAAVQKREEATKLARGRVEAERAKAANQ